MDFDGNTTYFESYFAMRRGLWDFNSPALMANSRCMAEIAANFPPGWLAIQRDDALFMFVQQRAVMIAAGSWDAQGIITQTRDSFDIGIFGFPMPTDHPVYGKFVHGPASEAASRGGIPWAINKHSPHTDICIDFLQFSTTAAANSDFNNRLTWLPIIRGARIYNERLRKFQPILHGYTGFFDYKISSAITIMERGNLWSLYAGQLSPEKNAEQMQKIYDRTASSGFTKKLDSLRRANRNLDRVITANIALRQVHQKKHTTTRKLILLNKASQSVAHKVAIYQKLFQNSNSQTTLSPPP
jgi:ABC-type glycerol-3-phosphate transport system substrate-binding protein